MNDLFSDVFSVASEDLGANPRQTHEFLNTSLGAPPLSQRRLVGTKACLAEVEEKKIF